MTFGMNKILISFTSTATAVFGVYFKLQSFVFMPIFGLNNGMVPIISYNYGARKPDRMMKTIKLSILYATCVMIIGVAIFMLIPDKLLSIFNASETMQQIGVPALRTISLSFVFAGFSICMLSVCNPWARYAQPLCLRGASAGDFAAYRLSAGPIQRAERSLVGLPLCGIVFPCPVLDLFPLHLP